MSSPFTLTIDWLAFTLPAGSAQDTMQMLGGDWTKSNTGFRGYPASWITASASRGVGKLGTGAPRAPLEVHVDLSGGIVAPWPAGKVRTVIVHRIYIYPRIYVNGGIVATLLNQCYPSAHMASRKVQAASNGTWIVKDVPRELMHRMKVAAAIQKKTLKRLLFELAEMHLQELEKKGLLPKGKG
jgi:hypothetical protein